jgi:hypothetical protein
MIGITRTRNGNIYEYKEAEDLKPKVLKMENNGEIFGYYYNSEGTMIVAETINAEIIKNPFKTK